MKHLLLLPLLLLTACGGGRTEVADTAMYVDGPDKFGVVCYQSKTNSAGFSCVKVQP